MQVEILRGGMNRLLLRGFPAPDLPTRLELFFQYVQYMDMPMSFPQLTVGDITDDPGEVLRCAELRREFKECRLFRLESGSETRGYVLAAACAYVEDDGPAGAPSSFFMM